MDWDAAAMKSVVFALALLSGCTALAHVQRYVPSTGWEDEWFAEHYEEWIGGQLRAMEEPSLLSPGEGLSQRTFRLLVLPSSAPAYAYRIEQSTSGAWLRWVKLDGRGGFEPGKIAQEGTRPLTNPELEELNLLIKRADLPTLPRHEQEAPTMICADGTSYVFEQRAPGSHTFFTRHECEVGAGALQRLIDATLRLAPITEVPRRQPH